jgi:hypothetical protein
MQKISTAPGVESHLFGLERARPGYEDTQRTVEAADRDGGGHHGMEGPGGGGHWTGNTGSGTGEQGTARGCRIYHRCGRGLGGHGAV